MIRTYATDPEEAGDENFSELAAPSAGLNRASWDFRHEGVEGIDAYQTFGSLAGRVAAPGQYQVRLTHGDASQTVDLTTRPDPRVDASANQYRAQEQFVADAQATLSDLYESVRELSNISDQVGSVVENTDDHPMADTIRTAGESLQEQITDWEGNLIQRQQQTFQDVINFKNQLDAQIAALIGSVDGFEPPVTAGARERWSDLAGQWQGHREGMLQILEAVGDFNQWLTELGIDPIVIPGAGRTVS